MSAAGLSLLQVLGLGELGDTAWWNVILRVPKKGDDYRKRQTALFEFGVNVGVGRNILSPLRLFIANDAISAESALDGSKHVLGVTLFEEHPRAQAPRRVLDAISCVNDIYDVLVKLNAEPVASPLRLIGLDSGSDKTFTFQGPEKIIAEVKDFLLQVFDRLAFYRQRKLSFDITIADEALGVLEKLNSAQREGRISVEEAEILRRKILGARTKAVDTGLVTTDMETRSVNLRLIVGPAQRQLPASSERLDESDENPPA